MEHLALIIFSTCLQAAIGIMIFLSLATILNKEVDYKKPVIVAAALAVVGVIASVFHLGKPFSALNSLAQFGSSWLSREIWFSAIFAALVVVAAILVLVKPQTRGAVKGLAWAAAIVGLIDVFVMASIYNYASVPAWQSAFTFVEFYAAAISMGGVLYLALSGNQDARLKKIVGGVIGVMVALQVAFAAVYFVNLGLNPSLAAHQSLMIFGAMSGVNIIKWILIVAGALLLLVPVKEGSVKNLATLTLTSAVLLLAGQIAARYIFYAVMVVGRVGLW